MQWSDLSHTAELICPRCSHELTAIDDCPTCGRSIKIRHGIPSFSGETNIDQDRERKITLLETHTLHDLRETVTDRRSANDLYHEMYHGHHEDWRLLLQHPPSGRCLVLNPTSGNLPVLVAETAECVFAVDCDLGNLRLMRSREDFPDSIYPVHTSIASLPFRNESFDTVIIDYREGPNPDTSLLDIVRTGCRYLTADGHIAILFDGLMIRLSELIRQRGTSRELHPVSTGKLRALEQTLTSRSFEKINAFAVVPSSYHLQVVFNVDHTEAINWLWRNHTSPPITALGQFLWDSRIARYCYPSYVVAGTRSPGNPPNPFANDREYILTAGRGRSIVFEITGSTLNRVLKIPNRKRNSRYNINEMKTIDALHRSGTDFEDKIPRGEFTWTRFGPMRIEDPVNGISMTEMLDGTVESFSSLLDMGLTWLANIQLQTGCKWRTASEEEVRAELRYDPLGIEPTLDVGPTRVFSSPTHGDFLPGNIFVQNGQISQVIDWEYGRALGNPITDSGYFLLRMLKEQFGTIRRGLEKGVIEDTCTAKKTQASIRNYCQSVQLPTKTFVIFLPIAYIERMRIDQIDPIPCSLFKRNQDRKTRIRCVQSYHSSMIDVLE